MTQWWLRLRGYHLPSHVTLVRHLLMRSHAVTWQISSSSTRSIINKRVRVVTKGDGFLPFKISRFFMSSSEITWKLKNGSLLSKSLYPPNCQVSMFRVRGSPLPSHIITRSHAEWKIHVRIQIFVLQDSRTAKPAWEETHNETWCDKIMLSTPQRFRGLNSC